MPKLSIPKGTGPRALAALAGLPDFVTSNQAMPGDMLNPVPGRTVSPRTAVRYAARALGHTREEVATWTVDEMRGFWTSNIALLQAMQRDAWRASGSPQPVDDDEQDDDAPQPTPTAPVAHGGLDALLGGIIAAQVAAQVDAALARRPAIDPEEVARIARDAAQVVRVEVSRPGEPPKVVEGVHHAQFPLLLRMLAARQNVYLYGPAGSGKSTAAKAAASALGLTFGSTGKVDSKYDLLGFRDAHGRTVRTPFREAWEHGGLFLFDELDRSDPGAVLALNNGLATGQLDFADGTVPKHPDTRVVAGGNTRLAGGDRHYVGAVAQDASVQDRFAFLAWGYDERLERLVAGDDQVDWTLWVQRVRAACKRLKVDVLVTPRSSIEGATMLRAGIERDVVEEAVVWRGADATTVAKVRAEVG